MKDLKAVSGAAGKLTSAKATVDGLRAEAAAGKDVADKLAAAERAYASASRSAAKYNVTIKNSAAVHAQAAAQMKRTEDALKRQEAYQRNRAKRSELKGEIMGTVASVAVVAAPVKMAMDFESAMADAAKTIDGMRDKAGNLTPEYYKMESAVKALGRELPLTHDEIARLFAAGGQQGLTGIDDLREFATMSAHMSVAFGMSTEEAADAIGGYRTALKLSMPEIRGVLDLMNQFANTTSASEKGIADIVRRIGPLGSVGGVAAKPMTALAATLDAMKVSPEVAATGIKNLILAMTAGTAATKNQKAAYASLGIDTIKLSKQMQKDGPAAIISVLEAVKKLPKAQQLSTLQEIFGKESLGSIAPLLDNLELVKKNLITAGDESAYAGAMQQEFGNRAKTTANALIIAKNKASELAITIGSVMLPAFNDTLTVVGSAAVALAGFADAHPEAVRYVMMAVTAMAAFKVATLAGGFALTTVSDAWNMAKGAWAAGRVVCSLSTYTMIAQRTAAYGLAVGTRAVAAAQWLLNAAMSNNPIGWVVKGVMFLGGALVTLYNTCEPVRKVLDTIWDGFLAALKPVTDKVTWVWDKIQRIIKWFNDDADDTDAAANAKLAEQEKGSTASPSPAGAAVASPASAAAAPPPLPGTPPGMSPQDLEAYMAQAPTMPDANAAAMLAQQAAMPMPGMNGPAGGMPAPVTLAPSFTFTFSMDGVPDREFGQRVIESVEREKSAIQRILSGLLADAQRVTYG